MHDEILIAQGGEVKTLQTDEGLRVQGYLVRFGDPSQPDVSAERDFFTRDTDFGKHSTTPVYFNHRLPLKTRDGGALRVREQIGEGSLTVDDTGVLIDAIIYNADLYSQQLDRMGWSSGTAAHTVERKAMPNGTNFVERWHLGLDASLTPIPAEPRTRGIVPLKSLQEQPETANIQVMETKNMEQNIDALKAQMDGVSAQMETVLKALERLPAAEASGMISNYGGAADPAHKSLGDFMLAVARQDQKRLTAIYGVKANTLTEGSGAQVGVLVPPEYMREVLQVAYTSSPIAGLVSRQPVTQPSGEYPALDQFVTPTAGVGQTAFAAGMSTAVRPEAGSYTQTDMSMETVSWRLNDAASGFFYASRELVEDAPGLEQMLRSIIGIAVGAKTEYFILRGSGNAQPLGILNAPAAIGISPDTNSTFAYTDALEMISRFKQVGGTPVWIIHPSLIPDIGVFQVSTGGASLVSNISAGLGLQILGYRVIQSEHLPQADNSGCAILADLSAYKLFEKGGLYIDYSEHAAFTTGKSTWRFGMRMDGKPWLKSAITLSDPQGSFTQSPFVYFND